MASQDADELLVVVRYLDLIVLLLVGWLILAFPSVSSLHNNRNQCHDSQRDQLR